LFFLGLIFLVACNPGEIVSPVPPSPTDTPSSFSGDSAESVFGPGTFSLALPTGWDVIGPEVTSSDPERPYQLYLLGVDPSVSGGPGTSQVIVASAAKWTPEELAFSQCITCPQNDFITVTIAGQSALRTQIGGGDVPILITWYYVEHKGYLIAFAIHDPETLQPLSEVIETIQFD
jgi:hypothetical protein